MKMISSSSGFLEVILICQNNGYLFSQIRVFADDVVESSEVITGVTKIGDYELHDLVLLE